MPPEQSLTQKTLAYMAVTLGVCVLAIVVGRITGVFDNEPVIILGAMFAVTYIGWRLAQTRFWSLAGYIPVAILFAVGVYGSDGGKIDTYMVLFYGLAVLLARALKSARFTWFVLAGAIAVHLGLTSTGNELDTILAVAVTFGGCLAGISLINTIFASELREALHRAESAAGSLATEVEVRRKTEVELLDREKDLRSILEQNSDGIAVTDSTGLILDWNPAIAGLTGLPKDMALGKLLAEVFGAVANQPNAGPDTLWDVWQSVIEGEETTDKAAIRNVQVTQADGAVRIADLLIFRVESSGGTRGVLSARDVTIQLRHEAERHKLKQMESLGILAGGLAHDFNNLMTGVQGNLSIAKNAARQGKVEIEALDQAENACEKAHDLANRLLTFAKGGAPIIEVISVSDCITEAVAITLDDLKHHFDLLIPNELPAVQADRNQLRQAIQNVLQNAVEAAGGDGSIGIRAARVEVEPKGVLPLQPGTFVVVSISDDGPGIHADISTQIFEPYFTTRAGANGLGLATTYSILRRHGGIVTVDSNEGKGTTFQLYIPTEQVSAGAEKPPPSELASMKRVLVMDDDKTVRKVTVKMLQHLGYDADSASDGLEALRSYESAHSQGNPYDVVIMDLTIEGGIGGVEALQMIREQFPEITAVVSSGYSQDPVMASYADYGFKAVIAKPLTLTKMRTALNDLFGRSTTDGY